MRDLLRRQILPRLANSLLDGTTDAAILPMLTAKAVVTTDSYVVDPLFFPGGNIGSLAVYGAANDLAVAGARPRWISVSLIIEEGLAMATLNDVLDSIAAAAKHAGVDVATGDTKVVPRGAADKLFINTTGVGESVDTFAGIAAIRSGDELLVSGPIGRHGIAVLAAREELGFDPPPTSDSAPLYPAVASLMESHVPVKSVRDATRGGVAAVLHEWAAVCGYSFELDQDQIPVSSDVKAACELLGLDPLHVACEGTMVVAVEAGASRPALDALRRVPVSQAARRIGTVVDRRVVPVAVRRALGRLVPLDDPAGAPLPRIC